MATMSIGKAWEETVAFVAREASLLFPVVLLFVALPLMLLQEMTPAKLVQWSSTMKGPMPPVPSSYWFSFFLTLILTWFGALTLFALALRPGISVAEALKLASHRLPVLLGAALLAGATLFVAILLLSVPLILLAGFGGAVIAVVVLGLLALARLAFLTPLLIDDRLGAIASIKRAWLLTRGSFWRLVGFFAIMLIIYTVAGAAAQTAFGIIGGLVAGSDGVRLLGGIAAASVSAVVVLYLLVMLARLYRQAVG